MNLDQVLLFALFGLGTGALIAGIALGVVLFYRGSGVINLATGAIAMLAGYSFWSLRTGIFGADLPTAPALVVTFVFLLAVGVAIELLTLRPLQAASPLAKLAASLGVLLTLQAAMLLSFGNAQKPRPLCCRARPIRMLGGIVPLDRFILAGIVIFAAAVLAALYRWTRFGLATRAASENEVAAVLAGIEPKQLSLANTLLACLVSGGLGVLARFGHRAGLGDTATPDRAGARGCSARALHVLRDRLRGWAPARDGPVSAPLHLAPQSWYPTDHGKPCPGCGSCSSFVVIVIAMFWRGASLPGRGELIEKRLPFVPGRNGLLRTAVIGRVGMRGCAHRAAVRLPPGTDRLAARRLDLPLARVDHRVRRPDLDRASSRSPVWRASRSRIWQSTTASSSLSAR